MMLYRLIIDTDQAFMLDTLVSNDQILGIVIKVILDTGYNALIVHGEGTGCGGAKCTDFYGYPFF